MLDESATENFTKLGDMNGAERFAEISDCSSQTLNKSSKLTPKITLRGLYF